MYMEKLFDYTVNIFELNEEAKSFHEWFKTCNYKDDFSIEVSEHEGQNVLEVVQHNPNFSVDALEEVYLADLKKEDEDPKKIHLVN